MKEVRESVWSDMHKRSTGGTIRKEDELTEKDKKDLETYIKNFASEVVFLQGRGEEAATLDEFFEHVKNDNSIEDANKEKILQYVKDYWGDELCDDVTSAIEQIVAEYHNCVSESVWADMHKRSTGSSTRKEDEMLDSVENNLLNQTAKMFKHAIRYVDDNDDYYYSDTKEDFIYYIEMRKEEMFWTNVKEETYDRLIDYVNKKWTDGCKGIDEFISEYICECEGVPGGITPANVGGMGAITFPGPNGEPGSGDLPMPTGHVYQQVAPFGLFIKNQKGKKKKKKFRKEDEPCVHSPNAKVYDYVDDYREYVDRTYNKTR